MTDIIGGTPAAAADLIKDATIETFQDDVLKASMEVPVIVDFWATWCGPCKTLGPMLERQVQALGGKVRMVKVDTDKNQMLAQQLRIQSLPTVMAFVGGQPVDGFVGAQPDSEISAFIERALQAASQMGLGGAGKADAVTLVSAADEAQAAGDMTAALNTYAQALEIADPNSDEAIHAIAGMARCHLSSGNADQARQLLDMVPQEKQGLASIAQVKAMLDLGSEGAAAPLPDETPTDAEGFFALGAAQVENGQMEPAMGSLLSSIELDKDWNDGAAREKLLTLFEALGGTHPAVKQGRRKLSTILFA